METIKYANRKLLAENLRIRRAAGGLSQEGLAEAAGLNRAYIGAIERGERNVSLDNLEKLAQAFGINVPALFDPIDPTSIGLQFLERIRTKVR